MYSNSCRLSCALNVDEYLANEEDKLATDSEVDRRFQDGSVVIGLDHCLAVYALLFAVNLL